MKLAKGDDLSGSAPGDYVRWAIGAHQDSSPDFIVQLKRGANGFGEVVIAIVAVTLVALLARFLYQRKIFLRV